MVYELISKMFQSCMEQGQIIVRDIHIHDDEDYAEVVKILCSNEEHGWIVQESISGGKREMVWNHYENEFNSFIDAFKYAIEMEINSIAEAFICMSFFLRLWEKIPDEELNKRYVDTAYSIDKITMGC